MPPALSGSAAFLDKLSVELPHIVIDDGVEIGQGKFTVLNVPKVIEELKVMAEKLDVQGFNLKVV